MTYGVAKCARKACGKPFTRKTHNQRYCSTICQRLVHDKPKGKQRCGKFASSTPQQDILKLLKREGPQTTIEIQKKLSICSVATWMSTLRTNGFPVSKAQYVGTNKKTGRRTFGYALENPQ